MYMSNAVVDGVVESHEFLTADLAESQRLPHMAERRNDERKSVRVRARITIPGKSVLPSHTLDLSCSGASVTLPFDLALGQRCLIDLELQACGSMSAFHIPSEVRYCVQMGKSRFRAGIRFGDLDPATTALIMSALNMLTRPIPD
jgi:hypothetical protein